ncbi:MAG: aminotransferase [Alphaproteobacteria bacterium PA2]|nr:MAG: aminotransferase [Alphaproteobacteria bacterium PA2]
MTSPVYLDFNATAPVRPEAVEAMTQALARVGNPSSVHGAGRAARALLEGARTDVAALIGGPASTVVFTSGGTEANGLAIESAVAAGSRRLIVSAIEHDCVIEAAKASGAEVEFLPVDAQGVADLAWLSARLSVWDAADGRPLVALMAANNETGVIQPMLEASEIVRAHEGWLHVDAVQAAGKLAIDSRSIQADTYAVSAHKLGGPQGVGALTFGPRASLVRRQHGGGQERGRRAGTENLPGIAGFAAAARAALRDANDNKAWRDAAIDDLKAAGGVIVGENARRLDGTLCVAYPGFPAERQVMALDLAGVMISAGSACSSGKVKASHVLQAMGLNDLAACAIRVSGGWSTTASDWSAFVEAWRAMTTSFTARRASAA